MQLQMGACLTWFIHSSDGLQTACEPLQLLTFAAMGFTWNADNNSFVMAVVEMVDVGGFLNPGLLNPCTSSSDAGRPVLLSYLAWHRTFLQTLQAPRPCGSHISCTSSPEAVKLAEELLLARECLRWLAAT